MKRARPVLLILCLALGLAPHAAAARGAGGVDVLARDVERAQSVRAIKTLQRTYAQYAQFGLWGQVSALFKADADFTFDTTAVHGQPAIERMLVERYGGGRQGLPAGDLHTLFVETPLINLSADGRRAKGRWHVLAFKGAGDQASIEGGIFENDYVQDGGVWRIAAVRYSPQYAGPYEGGWTNWGGGDLPLVPYHYTPDSAGIAVPAPDGPAPAAKVSLAALERQIAALNDEDQIRNLQSAYGYYMDRKMWDDVVDLYAPEGVLEIGGVGVYQGPKGVRRALERVGPPGLTHGQMNDHPQFDTTVKVMPGGREAYARGIELGMLAEADKGEAQWTIGVFQNRYVKQNGVWKIREARVFPLLKTDYYKGWSKSRIVDPPADAAHAPDRPSAPAGAGPAMPAFLAPNPVTGQPVAAPEGVTLAATQPLTGSIAAPPPKAAGSLAQARRRLAMSTAYDGVENVATAYGDYLDDFQSPLMGKLFSANGFKVSAFAGYYVGPERITRAALKVWGDPPPVTRPGISFHWRIQPVINIAADGRSANVQQRLFQPRTSKEPSRPNSFYAAGFHTGMYHDQYVLEKGVWRMWNLSLDEPYVFSVDWKGGWAAAKDPTEQTKPRPSPLLTSNFLPDVPITSLGVREEHFRGGTGQTIEWPGILPMWFDYRNPVSGRTPEHYWPDCVPCVADPKLGFTSHGYLQPPSGPAPER